MTKVPSICGSAAGRKVAGPVGGKRPQRRFAVRLPKRRMAARLRCGAMGRRFADLKARFQAGQLDTASYEAALHELMVEHEGAFWTLGAEMEVWYRHDGTQWVQDTPVGKYRVKEPYRLS